MFTLCSFLARRHTLTSFLSSTASSYSFAVTNVYAPSDHRDTPAFLHDLQELATHIHGNWALAGDFNLTRGREENSNGTSHTSLCTAFNDTIDHLGLIDLPLLDRLFTWSNHRGSPTLARLDRVLFNVQMRSTFPNSSLSSLPKPTSDHTPIQLQMSTSIPKRNMFRFENAWLKNPDYLPSVLANWAPGERPDAAAALAHSLKAVTYASKVWSRRKPSPPSLPSNYKFVIYLLDVLEEYRYLSAGEQVLSRACQDRLALFLREQAAYWKQRGKYRAMREGDANTKFFHAQATQRMRGNNIRSLLVDGELLCSHHEKTAALTGHLRTLLSARAANQTAVDLAMLYSGMDRVDGSALTVPFTDQEAQAAIRSMNKSSSPGPDGFGPSFYAATWQNRRACDHGLGPGVPAWIRRARAHQQGLCCHDPQAHSSRDAM